MILAHDGISPSIHSSCFLAHNCVIIGNVTIGAESSVWFKAIARGDINHIRIGKWTNLQDSCIVHVTRETSPTEIGDYVRWVMELSCMGVRSETAVLSAWE